MGIVSTTANASVLINYEKEIMIGIYVNDPAYTAKQLQLLNKFEIQLKKNLK